MSAYYNENDPFAAHWLRNLIAAGHIAAGDVDERSIVDVRADDLAGYMQCHFFAGIGGWSLALRLADWPDDRPVWTGSCPCQPFSAAGAGKAADDERHLWPAWFPLIAELRPAIVFGEQVEAAIGWGWLDAVFADLEAEGYACGTAVLPACGVGAPHIRQRCWFVADANGRHPSAEGLQRGGEHGQRAEDGGISRVADTPRRDRRGHGGEPRGSANPSEGQAWPADGNAAGGASGMVNAAGQQMGLPGRARQPRSTHWDNADWLPCTDGKARPVEPGTFPLAHGIPGRVGRLRAYGNAIIPQVAAEFIAAMSDILAASSRATLTNRVNPMRAAEHRLNQHIAEPPDA